MGREEVVGHVGRRVVASWAEGEGGEGACVIEEVHVAVVLVVAAMDHSAWVRLRKESTIVEVAELVGVAVVEGVHMLGEEGSGKPEAVGAW